jgi:hypothetical protein
MIVGGRRETFPYREYRSMRPNLAADRSTDVVTGPGEPGAPVSGSGRRGIPRPSVGQTELASSSSLGPDRFKY